VSLAELIERCEKASGADEIALLRKVGLYLVEIPDTWTEDAIWTARFEALLVAEAPTEAALALVERKLPGWYWRAGKMTAPKWERGAYQPFWAHIQSTHSDHCDREDEATGYAATAPLAIILALLSVLSSRALRASEQ